VPGPTPAPRRPGPRRSWPGAPWPLGATWDGDGVNVAVFSEGAQRVEVCLLSDPPGGGAGVDEERVELEESTFHVWHGYLPGVSPGQRYGFRVHGRYDPSLGMRWDASKLLVDPYARALCGGLSDHPSVYGGPGQDSAPHVPHSVVVHDVFPWGDDRRPGTSYADTVIYELHVRGFTAQHPEVPPELRGTYAGLAHPAAVEHLVGLGVTAVELLPVHHFVSEPHLLRRGLENYWGYNSLGYFAPHAAYSSSGTRGEQVREFKAMVRALHRAGIEVILDVVYNHTAEGDETGPTVAFRGLDNPAYYRLEAGDHSRYRDYTGCGNTLDARQPHVLQLIMDSLRYWVAEMHVDGFRFDLASALARSLHDVDKLSAFFDLVHQDPIVNRVKLIAEPWDVGDGGYQVGGFPALWTEWNGRYRDAVRSFWLAPGTPAGRVARSELGSRLTGSADLYQGTGRGPSASVNFVTAHDGFTLADLVSYGRKHNDANGEGGADGSDDNRSDNAGVEGRTDDTDVLGVRRRRRRALLATLLLSSGVPMLTAGDELGRTQEGNNNAYCQDSSLSWLDWGSTAGTGRPGASSGTDPAGNDPLLLPLVTLLLALRARSPVLRQQSFFHGHPVGDSGVSDIAWFTPSGRVMEAGDWQDATTPVLVAYLSGEGIRTRGPHGERVTDASYLLALNPGADALPLTLPGLPYAAGWSLVLDTSAEVLPSPTAAGTAPRSLSAQSVLLLRARLTPQRD